MDRIEDSKTGEIIIKVLLFCCYSPQQSCPPPQPVSLLFPIQEGFCEIPEKFLGYAKNTAKVSKPAACWLCGHVSLLSSLMPVVCANTHHHCRH